MTVPQRQMYINGEWTEAVSGQRVEVSNPATGEIIATVPHAGAADVEQAVTAASAAFPHWSGLTALERSRYLRRVYEGVVAKADELAAVLTEEQGKPLAEARGEVLNGAEYVNWYADEARRIYGEIIPAATPQSRIWVIRQPVGVVAAITPWNFPSSMITRKVAPALAAGCTIVIKPAEQTPLSALALGEIFAAAGLPPGVVNIVTTADPAPVGEQLLRDRRVAKISFTGSTDVGKYLMKGSAQQLKRVSLELGGHAPLIVFADADLELAVRSAVASKFRNAGQTCICANRIYVQEAVRDTFVTQFTAAVKGLRLGHGVSPGVQVGPLIEEAAYEKVAAQVAEAQAKGARVLTGGQRASGDEFAGGYFYEPTVLDQVSDDMNVVHEETFGPVAPVMSFRTEDEVIARANDTDYGLAAYVFTRNLGRTVRVGERLQYGMVAVNDALLAVPQAPFGGVKHSGYGREGGHHGLDGFLEYKYMSVILDDDR